MKIWNYDIIRSSLHVSYQMFYYAQFTNIYIYIHHTYIHTYIHTYTIQTDVKMLYQVTELTWLVTYSIQLGKQYVTYALIGTFSLVRLASNPGFPYIFFVFWACLVPPWVARHWQQHDINIHHQQNHCHYYSVQQYRRPWWNTAMLARSCENVNTAIPKLWATALQGTAGYFKILFYFFQFICVILSND
jgi:hypothetical protein